VAKKHPGGRPKKESYCPKCGANQKDARNEDAPAPAPRPPRRSSVLMEPIPDESAGEFGEEGGENEGPDEEDLEETAELGAAEQPVAEEEEEY